MGSKLTKISNDNPYIALITRWIQVTTPTIELTDVLIQLIHDYVIFFPFDIYDNDFFDCCYQPKTGYQLLNHSKTFHDKKQRYTLYNWNLFRFLYNEKSDDLRGLNEF